MTELSKQAKELWEQMLKKKQGRGSQDVEASL